MKVGLIETCKEIVALQDDFILDMEYFEDASNLCGTSYCIAGRLAHLDDYPKEFMEEFEFITSNEGVFNCARYSTTKIGDTDTPYFADSETWSFLFSELWPDNLIAAKERAQYVIDNGGIPEGWCLDEAEEAMDEDGRLFWSKS